MRAAQRRRALPRARQAVRLREEAGGEGAAGSQGQHQEGHRVRRRRDEEAALSASPLHVAACAPLGRLSLTLTAPSAALHSFIAHVDRIELGFSALLLLHVVNF